MTAKTYGITPPDYQPHTIRTTRDDESSGGTYWSPSRLQESLVYQHQVYRFAAQLIQQHDFTEVIDVGSGGGAKLAQLAKQMPEVNFTGIDQPQVIEFCQTQYSHVNWDWDDFENPRTDANRKQAQLIICSDVIEHLEDPDKLLSFIQHLATPQTTILLSTPERDKLYGRTTNRQPMNPAHIREWTQTELANYLTETGFNIEQHFTQHGIKIGLNRPFLKYNLRRIVRGYPLDYNQVVVMKKSS